MIDQNAPAYPCINPQGDMEQGMTIRLKIATRAMQSLIRKECAGYIDTADEALQFADALISRANRNG